MKRLAKTVTTMLAAASLLNPASITSAHGAGPTLTLATASGTPGAAQARDPSAQAPLDLPAKIALLRQKVKYVFVLFQENRSYDHYFGTYPGANGLFSTYPGADPSDIYAQAANATKPDGSPVYSSFQSVIRNVDGTYATIHPFLIPRSIVNQAGTTVNLYPEDLYSVDHSHRGYINDFHLDAATKSIPRNDGYPLDQQGLHYATDASGTEAQIVSGNDLPPTTSPNLQAKQKAEVVISHIDCDTIPFLWQYADRFVLFDNFHQSATGPSTPNAIAMIAGQVGDTQWARHGANGSGSPNALPLSVPNLTDTAPFPGSTFDNAAVKPPYGPDDAANPNTDPSFASNPKYVQVPLTFASLPLSFMGHQIQQIIGGDQHPDTDLADVRQDIPAIAEKNPAVNWGWYQQGYGPEPFDGEAINENGVNVTTGVAGFHWTVAPQHLSYIVHHNGPQYFGYLGDNRQIVQPQVGTTNPGQPGNMHGLQQFYTDVGHHALPESGGVFYVRGGYYNNDKLMPIDPNPNVQRATPGNDDHPNYSDAQISEALIADSVNAIAASPYWDDCAIIITYDESDGLFDHQPEQFRTWGPDGLPETGGPRIPTIVISPFAAAHTVSHAYSEHSSVIKFINQLFGLIPLADLPDEAQTRARAAETFKKPDGSPQTDLGPADALSTMGDLLEAFDNDRLRGTVPPLPPSYAMIPREAVTTLPHYQGNGCATIGIVPTDYPGSYAPGSEIDPPPLDFNPRPTQSPGSPYYNTSNNTTPGSATGTGTNWPY